MKRLDRMAEQLPEQQQEQQPQAEGVGEEELANAEKWSKEAAKLIIDEPGRAAELLSKVGACFMLTGPGQHTARSPRAVYDAWPQALEIRTRKYGEDGLECAETYLQYGRALIENVRANTDALGAKMQTAAQKHDDSKAAKDTSTRTAGAGPSTGGGLSGKTGVWHSMHDLAAALGGSMHALMLSPNTKPHAPGKTYSTSGVQANRARHSASLCRWRG